MWSEKQCRERRVGTAAIISSWAIVAILLLGMIAWSGLRAFVTKATIMIGAEQETPAASEAPRASHE